MAKRSIELRNWKMWVINRYGTLVVDVPDGMDEETAKDAITEYISMDLDEEGEMDEFFGEEEKIGPPEAGDTVIDSIEDAPLDANPHLRLVENDGYITVEVVGEEEAEPEYEGNEE